MRSEYDSLIFLNTLLFLLVLLSISCIAFYTYIVVRSRDIQEFWHRVYGLCHDYNLREIDKLREFTHRKIGYYDAYLIYNLVKERVPHQLVILFSFKKVTFENYLPPDLYQVLINERDATRPAKD